MSIIDERTRECPGGLVTRSITAEVLECPAPHAATCPRSVARRITGFFLEAVQHYTSGTFPPDCVTAILDAMSVSQQDVELVYAW